MTHDYSERMSLMLDGRLSAQERVELEAHLAMCNECRARWSAFQQVDRVLASAATVAPAPGFANRFAERARLAKQSQIPVRGQAELAQRGKRERAIAWVGVFAAGAAALVLLIVPAIIAAWTGINGLIESAPSLFVNVVEGIARWLVTLGALGEAGRSILDTLAQSGGPLLVGYALMLVLVTAAWIAVMKSVSRRWNTVTLPVLVWL